MKKKESNLKAFLYLAAVGFVLGATVSIGTFIVQALVFYLKN